MEEKTFYGKKFVNLFSIAIGFILLFYIIPELKELPIVLKILFSIAPLFLMYHSVNTIFSEIKVTNNGIVEIEKLIRRERSIPFKSIKKIYSRFNRYGWSHIIELPDRSIIISDYSRWRECLFLISERIDKNLIDLDVQKSIGLI